MLKIASGLEADGILNDAGRERWHTSNISTKLRNEKYIGDALLQKLTEALIRCFGQLFY